jgi:hypothetical protein
MAEERQQAREKVHRLEQELFDLDEQIKATEGYRIQTKIRGLGGSYYVFESNYLWLVRALDYFGREEVSLELWRLDNRTKLGSFIDEVTRLLHNFLASAHSLVDHTRVFKNKMYKGHTFKKVYQDKVDRELKHSPTVSFVQDLRNYVLHKQLPIASAQLSLKGGGALLRSLITPSSWMLMNSANGTSGNLRVAFFSIRWTTRCRFGKWPRSTRALSGPFISGSVSNRRKCTAPSSPN